MKTLTVISGKGGTGKTTMVAAIADMIERAVLADCDVDAPNLHLLLSGKRLRESEYWGAKEAVIAANCCSQCGRCREVCRFGAISEQLKVDALLCEGCGACRVVCPENAITLVPVVTGILNLDQVQKGYFAHALLNCGAEGSGKLVTEVRKLGEEYQTNEPWMVLDGSPGIGCAVIASITGADLALVVTEPTLSGLSDLTRIIETVSHFDVLACVCINKYDINLDMTEQIKQYCKESGIQVVGTIPFDRSLFDSLQKLAPVSAQSGPAAVAIRKMWNELDLIMEGG